MSRFPSAGHFRCGVVASDDSSGIPKVCSCLQLVEYWRSPYLFALTNSECPPACSATNVTIATRRQSCQMSALLDYCSSFRGRRLLHRPFGSGLLRVIFRVSVLVLSSLSRDHVVGGAETGQVDLGSDQR